MRCFGSPERFLPGWIVTLCCSSQPSMQSQSAINRILSQRIPRFDSNVEDSYARPRASEVAR